MTRGQEKGEIEPLVGPWIWGVLGVIGLVFVAMAYWPQGKNSELLETKTSTAKPEPLPVVEDVQAALATQAQFEKFGWPLVDNLRQHREKYTRDLWLDQFPFVEENWTEAYFTELWERKQKAIAFYKTSAVTICFIGTMHHAQSGDGPLQLQQIAEAHADSQVWVRRFKPNANVLMVEMAGSSIQPFTEDTFRESIHNTLFGLYNRPIPDEHVEYVYQNDLFGKLFREHPDLPMVPGEEWPFLLAGKVTAIRSQLTHRRDQPAWRHELAKSLTLRLMVLRTEISLIRAAEHLEANDGDGAIFVFGAFHGMHAVKLKDEYGYKLVSEGLTPVTPSR